MKNVFTDNFCFNRKQDTMSKKHLWAKFCDVIINTKCFHKRRISNFTSEHFSHSIFYYWGKFILSEASNTVRFFLCAKFLGHWVRKTFLLVKKTFHKQNFFILNAICFSFYEQKLRNLFSQTNSFFTSKRHCDMFFFVSRIIFSLCKFFYFVLH